MNISQKYNVGDRVILSNLGINHYQGQCPEVDLSTMVFTVCSRSQNWGTVKIRSEENIDRECGCCRVPLYLDVANIEMLEEPEDEEQE